MILVDFIAYIFQHFYHNFGKYFIVALKEKIIFTRFQIVSFLFLVYLNHCFSA